MFPSSSRAMPGSHPFPGSIRDRLGLAVLAFLLLLVAVGGVSSYLAWSILSIAQDIPLQSHHVQTTEEIQSNVQHLIHETYRAVIHSTLDRDVHVRGLTARTADMITAFLDDHLQDDEPFPEKRGEIALMRRLDALHAEASAAMATILGEIRALAPAGANELAVLDRAAREVSEAIEGLRTIHQAKIRRLLDAGAARMKLILGAFAAFLVLGGACGAAGIRLYREVGSLATLQERERIAREIHDGVAQGVAFLHLRLKTLEDRLARGGAPASVAEVADMRAVSKRAYADVRQSIFGLRTATARNLGLIPLLTEYVREFSRESGIQVEVQDGNPRATDFSPEAEVQLVRVIQEALNNVRKHARARRAWVRFAVDGGNLGRVTVEDDGIGFPVRSARDASRQRYGLRTMQERTEGAGGQLEVRSGSGHGTQVIIRLPLAKVRSAA